MKLFRTDLDQGLSDRLIDISIETLDMGELEVPDQKVSLKLSSEKTAHGFRLTGTIDVSVIEPCDRCLKPYQEKHHTRLNIVLTSDNELLSEKNVDVIWFPESEDFIDIGPILHDLVLLEEPIKRLCKESCKGLCPNCGQDLNQKICDCTTGESDSPWDTLKSLSNKN